MEDGEARTNIVAERLPALLTAVLSVGSDLELEAVLRRIVETAADLVDCDYGALGVIGEEYAHRAGHGAPGKTLVEFITTGVSDEVRKQIGPPPHGAGILGLLVREPRVLRLADLTAHVESVGFPANHPPMNSFLGVPIRVRDDVFGNLYLTQKRSGDFTESDEAVVLTLATAAGVAIDNARRYDDARRSEDWQRSMAAVNQMLLAGDDSSEVLGLVAESARRLAKADTAAIGFADTEGNLVIEVADGVGAEKLIGRPLPLPEPSLLMPLAWPSQAAALCVANDPAGPRFGPAIVTQLQTFAGQAVLALELAEARKDSERVAVFEDRDRIARDLHDTVIQRLFAAGMHLESVSRRVDSDAATRVRDVVDDLDATIRDIRSTIYSLQTTERGARTGFRSRVSALLDQMASILGVRPSLQVDGLLDTMVSEDLADDVVAVVREVLSNVAKHAHATRVEVSLRIQGSMLDVVIRDDGVGFDSDNETMRRSGLANLQGRAQARIGSCSVTSHERTGDAHEDEWATTVTWTAPLSVSPGRTD